MKTRISVNSVRRFPRWKEKAVKPRYGANKKTHIAFWLFKNIVRVFSRTIRDTRKSLKTRMFLQRLTAPGPSHVPLHLSRPCGKSNTEGGRVKNKSVSPECTAVRLNRNRTRYCLSVTPLSLALFVQKVDGKCG